MQSLILTIATNNTVTNAIFLLVITFIPHNLQELALEYPYMKAMHPVGRLDADTSGLLLFSSDGHLTQMLLHPSTGVEREYEAVVAGYIV